MVAVVTHIVFLRVSFAQSPLVLEAGLAHRYSTFAAVFLSSDQGELFGADLALVCLFPVFLNGGEVEVLREVVHIVFVVNVHILASVFKS